MNLEPNIWGPSYWNTLHFIASTYENNPSPSKKNLMKTFIKSIPVLLPCKECQDHAFEYISQVSIDSIVKNRQELFTFFFTFHNAVNKRLNKPLMSIEKALNLYFIPKDEHHLYYSVNQSQQHQPLNKFFIIVGLILIILGIRVLK